MINNQDTSEQDKQDHNRDMPTLPTHTILSVFTCASGRSGSTTSGISSNKSVILALFAMSPSSDCDILFACKHQEE
jgi:hypothetical protein